MENKFTQKQRRFFRFITIVSAVLIIFKAVDFAASEIADRSAYADAKTASAEEWESVYSKITEKILLTEEDYSVILSQTGLGKPAVDALISESKTAEIEKYHDYYTADKDFLCIREGVFACHERILDARGDYEYNPPFADLQNGDILLTLSIHSLGWRHGHAAVVVDAENGVTAEALMIGEDSCLGTVGDWKSYPLVAVLRAKDVSTEVQNEIARFAEHNLIGIPYSLTSGIVGGRSTENVPASTQCAHFVWFAYKAYGIDIDSDGGRVVTPYDILHSDKLEIVQIYGNII